MPIRRLRFIRSCWRAGNHLDWEVMPSVLEPVPVSRPKVGFVSLGCPKNLVDSEVMMGLLHHNGAEMIQKAVDADIIVINTCSFIDSAKQESVNTILEMVQHKREHGGKASRIVVAGCLVERYRDEIRASIPEVDAVVGTGELEAILEAAGLSPQSESPFHILPRDFAGVAGVAAGDAGGGDAGGASTECGEPALKAARGGGWAAVACASAAWHCAIAG